MRVVGDRLVDRLVGHLDPGVAGREQADEHRAADRGVGVRRVGRVPPGAVGVLLLRGDGRADGQLQRLADRPRAPCRRARACGRPRRRRPRPAPSMAKPWWYMLLPEIARVGVLGGDEAPERARGPGCCRGRSSGLRPRPGTPSSAIPVTPGPRLAPPVQSPSSGLGRRRGIAGRGRTSRARRAGTTSPVTRRRRLGRGRGRGREQEYDRQGRGTWSHRLIAPSRPGCRRGHSLAA